MKVFANPGQFAAFLLKAAAEVAVGAQVGLEAAAKLIQTDAQGQLGNYQPAVGGFPAWAPLSPVTLGIKETKGYPVPSPLLVTGALRDSIVTEVSPWEAIIGSTSPIAAYQEFGTSTTGWGGAGIPPRPFLGPAAFKNKEAIRAIIGAAVIAGFSGGTSITFKGGYNMEV